MIRLPPTRWVVDGLALFGALLVITGAWLTVAWAAAGGFALFVAAIALELWLRARSRRTGFAIIERDDREEVQEETGQSG